MIRLMLAEDMHLIRKALVALLSSEDDLEVVAEADKGEDIVRLGCLRRPDVAVLDIGMPGVDGLTAAAELHRRLPSCRTVVLTGLGTPMALRKALDANVRGFVVKDASPGHLVDCIRRVAKGERVIDPELAVAALDADSNPLTARELDVLETAAGGATVGEIADRLSLSRGTVRNYLSRILTKVGARSRVEAIQIASECGWLWPAVGRDIGILRYRSRR
ncbi:response regulator transcription factor [Microbispora bryophytorum]|uniref:DNA-binding response regulator n=1 Tax=Microbispora bryophytorum TaxID=1460882 RepID=A0A8H9H6M8_9ACTN|nr:response regulator transcription factor [Microbispora bryophytorum]MBD3139403.1 response regulator transcription factor [Microbispora bryophytorum]TQS04525.1 response regulator transcription factor [Microbispora bryophytorum]GGO23353.1 DNA-binding response regulator [Microbispora bryophytorum]